MYDYAKETCALYWTAAHPLFSTPAADNIFKNPACSWFLVKQAHGDDLSIHIALIWADSPFTNTREGLRKTLRLRVITHC